MLRRRQIIGGLASVLLHGALLAWVVGRAPSREPAEPAPVEVEWIEVASLAGRPLARHATEGSPGEAAPGPAPARGEAAVRGPETRPEPRPAASEPAPPKPRAPRARPKAPTAPSPAPQPDARATTPDEPEAEPEAEPEPEPEPEREPEPAEPEPEPAEPASSPSAADHAGRTHPTGTSNGNGRSSRGRMGTGDSPDHSAYGAELVRLMKVEIDTDPVPGLRPHDAVEVELEVLPSGRLARRGLGRYDYARVVRSTVGPVRMRMILRRILRASYDFPPHPSSFPRERYVVGFTVRFHDRSG